MVKALLKYNYPQVVFAKEIISYLLDTGRSCKKIIDCPCGNGETAWLLSQIGGKVIAADSSAEAIKRAASNFSGPKLTYEVNTIESVLNSHPQFDVFCIINSLFLLEGYDQILKTLKQSVSKNNAQLIIIIPNTQGKNFKWFQSQNTNENKLILEEKDIASFFVGYGFKTELIKPVCYTHHYNRTDVKLFSVFWSVYLNFLNKLQSLFKIGKPNYFLIALSS